MSTPNMMTPRVAVRIVVKPQEEGVGARQAVPTHEVEVWEVCNFHSRVLAIWLMRRAPLGHKLSKEG